jgi:hypothetical protein
MDIVNTIVNKIRHQSQWIIGQDDMYQPFYPDQYEIIDALNKAGVFMDVIISTGVLLEGNDSILAKSSLFKVGDIFHKLKENKSILFYFWAIQPCGMVKLRYAKSSKIIRPLQRYRKELNSE